MFKLNKFFRKTKLIPQSKVIEKVLSKDGQEITEWERNYMESSKWMCPNCESGHLYDGPSGGASQNIRCLVCGQGYNVTPFGIDNIGINETFINNQKLRSVKLNKIKNNVSK
jgi:hypothetical protein